jgi:putative alpha-1,2-mannosidase
MMVAPSLFDDVDGRYRGMDGNIQTLQKGAHNYSTFSLWDTYRALHPMYTLFLPERVPDFVNCLIRMAEQSPRGVPVWPLQGSETGCMVGYHSAPVVAEAIAKDFPGIDTKAAYAVFKKRAEVDDYRGLAAYRKLGYVPCDQQDESASKTLDYCYDDSAVAIIAKAAGQDDDEARGLVCQSIRQRKRLHQTSVCRRPLGSAFQSKVDPDYEVAGLHGSECVADDFRSATQSRAAGSNPWWQ